MGTFSLELWISCGLAQLEVPQRPEPICVTRLQRGQLPLLPVELRFS